MAGTQGLTPENSFVVKAGKELMKCRQELGWKVFLKEVKPILVEDVLDIPGRIAPVLKQGLKGLEICNRIQVLG